MPRMMTFLKSLTRKGKYRTEGSLESIPDHWSHILLEIRRESGLTRPDLSHMSGIGTSTIENYEQRKIIEPSIYKMEILLGAMGYDLDAIKKL
jgi:DNA-binding transcriptional regulator YiaG